MTTALVVLLAAVVGGGYVAWRWSQDQYYIGADSKGQEVVIFRGVNQHIAGISLSHPYHETGIKLTQVPPSYQQTVKATDAASSLNGAQAIVANIRSAVTKCQQGYTALQQWVAAENAYQAKVTLAKEEPQVGQGHRGDPGTGARGRPPPRCASLPPPSASRLMPSSRPLGPRDQYHRPVARSPASVEPSITRCITRSAEREQLFVVAGGCGRRGPAPVDSAAVPRRRTVGGLFLRTAILRTYCMCGHGDRFGAVPCSQGAVASTMKPPPSGGEGLTMRTLRFCVEGCRGTL